MLSRQIRNHQVDVKVDKTSLKEIVQSSLFLLSDVYWISRENPKPVVPKVEGTFGI